MLVFEEGKPEHPEKISRCRAENQQPQPTYDASSGNRTRATLVGGECPHHCAIPVPQQDDKDIYTTYLTFWTNDMRDLYLQLKGKNLQVANKTLP